MDDFDRRLVPTRSDAVQSLGLPYHWFTDSLRRSVPAAIPTQLVLTTIPTIPVVSVREQPWVPSGMSGGTSIVGSLPTNFSTPGQWGRIGVGSHVGSGMLTSWEPHGRKQGMAMPNVPESTFLPIHVAGLQQPIRSQVKHQHPRSVAAVMALAIEFDGSTEKPVAQLGSQRRIWPPKDQKGPAPAFSQQQQQSQTSTKPIYARGPEYSKLPVIHLTAAQRADRTRRGLCIYCEVKWVSNHACKRLFLAYMGSIWTRRWRSRS